MDQAIVIGICPLLPQDPGNVDPSHSDEYKTEEMCERAVEGEL